MGGRLTDAVMMHYYACTFSVYRLGNRNSRPHTVVRYVSAKNAQDAYKRAQEICATRALREAFASDEVVCRHRDVRPLLADEARKDIANNPSLVVP